MRMSSDNLISMDFIIGEIEDIIESIYQNKKTIPDLIEEMEMQLCNVETAINYMPSYNNLKNIAVNAIICMMQIKENEK